MKSPRIAPRTYGPAIPTRPRSSSSLSSATNPTYDLRSAPYRNHKPLLHFRKILLYVRKSNPKCNQPRHPTFSSCPCSLLSCTVGVYRGGDSVSSARCPHQRGRQIYAGMVRHTPVGHGSLSATGLLQDVPATMRPINSTTLPYLQTSTLHRPTPPPCNYHATTSYIPPHHLATSPLT